MIIENILLQREVDKISWPMEARTAMGLNLVSMGAMLAIESVVGHRLTAGVVAIGDPQFCCLYKRQK